MSDPLEALLELIARDEFILSEHARMRMRERGVIRDDICEAAAMAHSIWTQAKGVAVFKGPDIRGDDLTVVADYRSEVVIITIY